MFLFFFNAHQKVLSNETPSFLDILNMFVDEMEKQGEASNNKDNWGSKNIDLNCDKNGSLKIIEDLCWDKYNSKEAWKKRFPNCAVHVYGTGFIIRLHDPKKNKGFPCKVSINGRGMLIHEIWFTESDYTSSGLRVESVEISYTDISLSRSVKKYITSQFTLDIDRSNRGYMQSDELVYCNKYSCFTLSYDESSTQIREIRPSDYTLSIIDGNMKVKPGMF